MYPQQKKFHGCCSSSVFPLEEPVSVFRSGESYNATECWPSEVLAMCFPIAPSIRNEWSGSLLRFAPTKARHRLFKYKASMTFLRNTYNNFSLRLDRVTTRSFCTKRRGFTNFLPRK